MPVAMKCFLLVYTGTLFLFLKVGLASRSHYAMYVWTTSFDRTIPGCDESKFLEWDKNGGCFSHSWDTREKRAWLWNTCNLAGREVDAIFLSGTHHSLRDAYNSGNCHSSGVELIRQTLIEGHSSVPGLKIYALYAVSDFEVSEKDLVKYVVFYNDRCATSQNERFDGVATNNEAYSPIKCGDMQTRLRYLDNLKKITSEAAKQQNDRLLTHFSVSWNWGKCDHGSAAMTWNGKSQDAVHHMIDIFDSVDVQVAYTIGSVVADRMRLAGYEYAKALGKKIFVTLYTDKTDPCQISFFPQPCRNQNVHTEAGLFSVIDSFDSNGIGYAHACIHYFRGVYSSGGNSDWPAHDSGSGVSSLVG